MEYITVKSYDGKIVRIPAEEKEEYLKNQNLIKKYLDEGKNYKEILEIMKK